MHKSISTNSLGISRGEDGSKLLVVVPESAPAAVLDFDGGC